jgi:MraZ protein
VSAAIGFIGKHEVRIDDKGRVTMPARFKNVLAEQYPADAMQVVVAVSLDRNLRVFPLSEYTKMTAEYERYSDLDRDARRLKEFVTGLATVEKVDAGGRIRLSADLRQIAGLLREVACVGGNGYFDIWDRERWNANQAQTLRDLEQLSEQVRVKTRPAP